MIVPPRYRGIKRIFEHDIAFLRVQFVVTAIVLPICVDLAGKFSLKSGDVGVVSTHTENNNKKKQVQSTPVSYCDALAVPAVEEPRRVGRSAVHQSERVRVAYLPGTRCGRGGYAVRAHVLSSAKELRVVDTLSRETFNANQWMQGVSTTLNKYTVRSEYPY
jgi:hypothetical protein